MKSTDLMVGDIIYRPDCYDKVVEIRLNGIIGKDSNRGLIPFSELKPIEITPEILEKNGFGFGGGYIYKLDDSQMVIEYSYGLLFGWVYCHNDDCAFYGRFFHLTWYYDKK